MADLESTKDILDSKLDKLKETKKDREYKANYGGARPGAGFPAGQLKRKTLERRAIKAEFDKRVMKNADRLFNAQLNLAVGEQYLMVKVTEGEGKNAKSSHEVVKDPELIQRFLDDNDGSPTSLEEEGHWYYLSTKGANNQAIDSLLNRGFGKPTEKIEIEGGNFFKADTMTINVVKGRDKEEIENEDREFIDSETTDSDKS